MRLGGHAPGVKHERWKLRCGEESPQPLPLPSRSAHSGAWCRRVHSSHACGLKVASPVSTHLCAHMCAHMWKERRGLCVCLFAQETVPHPLPLFL